MIRTKLKMLVVLLFIHQSVSGLPVPNKGFRKKIDKEKNSVSPDPKEIFANQKESRLQHYPGRRSLSVDLRAWFEYRGFEDSEKKLGVIIEKIKEYYDVQIDQKEHLKKLYNLPEGYLIITNYGRPNPAIVIWQEDSNLKLYAALIKENVEYTELDEIVGIEFDFLPNQNLINFMQDNEISRWFIKEEPASFITFERVLQELGIDFLNTEMIKIHWLKNGGGRCIILKKSKEQDSEDKYIFLNLEQLYEKDLKGVMKIACIGSSQINPENITDEEIFSLDWSKVPANRSIPISKDEKAVHTTSVQSKSSTEKKSQTPALARKNTTTIEELVSDDISTQTKIKNRFNDWLTLLGIQPGALLEEIVCHFNTCLEQFEHSVYSRDLFLLRNKNIPIQSACDLYIYLDKNDSYILQAALIPSSAYCNHTLREELIKTSWHRFPLQDLQKKIEAEISEKLSAALGAPLEPLEAAFKWFDKRGFFGRETLNLIVLRHGLNIEDSDSCWIDRGYLVYFKNGEKKLIIKRCSRFPSANWIEIAECAEQSIESLNKLPWRILELKYSQEKELFYSSALASMIEDKLKIDGWKLAENLKRMKNIDLNLHNYCTTKQGRVIIGVGKHEIMIASADKNICNISLSAKEANETFKIEIEED